MTEQHRAKPESWAFIKECAPRYCFESCILELRSRVEALEAAAKPVDELQAASAEARPDGLVEKVAYAIAGDFPVPYRWKPEARAAILAVADWLEQQGLHSFAKLLRQEAQ